MSTARHHTEWLSLVEINGPFLSLPVLLRTFPQGLDADDTDLRRELRLAYEEWRDNQQGLQPEPAIHRAWINYVLTTVLELPEAVLAEGQAIPPTLSLTIAEQQETLRPDLVIIEPDDSRQDAENAKKKQILEKENLADFAPSREVKLLIQTYPPGQDLDKPISGRHWKATPATRMMELCHATNVRLGLATNGEQWLLVNAPRGETTGFISWYAELWLEEKLTLRAFRSLLGVDRFFAVPDDETLPALLDQSQSEQHEVTDQLGYQVRRAVEVLVQAIDLADRDRGGALLAGVPESRLYEAALTLMMRLVFLFSAEERGLFPLDDELYSRHYAASTLREQLRAAADQFGEAVIERRLDAWVRLLALFRAIHGGIQHTDLRLPAYGGSLFDPDRFPFLEGRAAGSSWHEAEADPLPINNRTVLHLLEALQLLQVKLPGGGPSEARRLSFRALDIEQIGHVYESLLDHTAVRAEGVVLGLTGSKYNEPEVSLETLEAFLVQGSEFPVQSLEPGTVNPELINYLKDQTGRTENALRKALQPANSEPGTGNSELRVVCGNDDALYRRVLPFAGLLREDDLGRPVVILSGSVYVTAGTERRATGTHYTPKSLTEPIVKHTLEPLVYDGPAEGKPQEKWKLRSPARLLDLKVCDMAMGSGAFLVQTCRYLSERLVEAWENAEAKAEAKAKGKEDLSLSLSLSLTPEGVLTDNPDESIPANTDDRLIYAKRLIADRCLYGVDKNPLAVEMAKLSLWLVTLDKNRPFTFLDHALKCGDSLVGVDLDQLTTWSLEGEGERRFETMTIQSQIEQMIDLRRRLERTPVNSVADQDYKRQLFEQAEAVAHDLKQGGDMLVGSYFNDLSKTEQEYLRTALLLAFRDGQDVPPERAVQADLGDLRPFHWPLEFPEVFLAEGRSGFDAFVGNPPFQSGKGGQNSVTAVLGESYVNLLEHNYVANKRSADLCAYFFFSVRILLSDIGYFGLIATNSISEGTTSEVALSPILEGNGNIYRAEDTKGWPGSAAVFVSMVWASKKSWNGNFYLNEKKECWISARLDPVKDIGEPFALVNSIQAFHGTKPRGNFTTDIDELSTEKYGEQHLPLYLLGQDINSSPTVSASRRIIHFPQDTETKANEANPELFQILRSRVFDYRKGLKSKKLQKLWWKFEYPAQDLYDAINEKGLTEVYVASRYSNKFALIKVFANQIFADGTVVFLLPEVSHFVLLQSSIYQAWVRKYCATFKEDIRFNVKDVVINFPIFTKISEALETIGETYHEHRRQLMLDRQEGLTKTYNRFHDPEESAADIAKLRSLHVEMDQAVAAAYGWDDLDLGHGFHDTPQGLRYTISETARREVLGRLLELNHQRYEAEVKAGLHSKKKGRKGAKKQSRKKKGAAGKKSTGGQMKLF